MIYGYARVSTGGQSEAAQVRQLRAAGAGKVFREVASGAKSNRPQLRRLLAEIRAGDVVMLTRLDRRARSTRDLLYSFAAITAKHGGFRSLADTWADTTTPHGRLMLTVLGGLAEFERELIRARTGEGRERAKARGQSLGRPFKLTPHQRSAALRRRDAATGAKPSPTSPAATTSTRVRYQGLRREGGCGPAGGRRNGVCQVTVVAGSLTFPAEEQLLDVAVAQGEAEVEPNRVLDDLGREAMAAIRKLSHGLC